MTNDQAPMSNETPNANETAMALALWHWALLFVF
jgi:hypothetical protein